jgi:1,2-diacylglycerol 3-alpha-glucosyltransferase
LEIIPTGLRLEELSGGDGAAFRRQLGIGPEQPVLVLIGRLASEKNVEFLLEVFVEVAARLPSAVLLVAGEGPAPSELRWRVEARGLGERVRFLGYLARERELLDCYRAGDVFVFASRTETQGLVLLEAMALGVPVVSTAVMGTRDILAARRSALVDEEEVEEFAGRVMTLLQNRRLACWIGRQGREHAKEWSDRATTERLVGLYRDLLDEGAAGERGRSGRRLRA